MARDAYFASSEDIKRNLDDDRRSKIVRLRRGRAAYAGGSEAIGELVRRPKETPGEWNNRIGHYRNVPVVKHGVNTHAWLLYGMSPMRQVWVGDKPESVLVQMSAETETEPDETSEQYSQWVTNQLERNRDSQLTINAACQRIRDGIAVMKIWGVDESGTPALPFTRLRMDIHKAEDCWPVYDPDDPDVLLAIAEYRNKKWILWTADEVRQVKPDLSEDADIGEHPIPGVIPFAVFGDGRSMIADLIEYQKVLINRHSVSWAIERGYAFPTGVMSGTPTNIQTAPGSTLPGQPMAIDVGSGFRYLHFEDPQGGFSWVSADAPVDKLRESYQAELKEAMELGAGLPHEGAGLDGASPEQPTTIALRWLRSFISRDRLVLEAMAFEDMRMFILASFGAVYGSDFGLPGLDADAVDWDILFPQNPLPQDKRLQQESERAEVLANLRPEVDYVRRHVATDASVVELGQIMDLLAEQKQGRFGGNGVPVETPPLFGEEEEEEA